VQQTPEDQGEAPAEEEEEPTPFSELLDYLFMTTLKTLPDGRQKRPTLRDVANATGISISYLSEARRGAKENPPKEFIELLARYFDVPPAYFFGQLPGHVAHHEHADPRLVSDPVLDKILLRASAYGRREKQLLLDWMDSVERAREIGKQDRQDT